jgi:FAD/FMN-containing dehydrogenase
MDPASLVDQLGRIVGANHATHDAAELAPYLTDWRRSYHGHALAVVSPATTGEVAAVVAACAASGTPIVPQGGNTGLVGGATPDPSGRAVVLSTRRLRAIRAVDPVGNTITAEAGVVLANVQQAAQQAQRLFPLSLASEGSCTLGGNLSTNAGGTAVLRYGNARELCLALEVVLPDGRVIGSRDGVLPGLRKDNTGYDLRNLFIGAEGTLGIITAATMRLYPLPRARVTALAGLASPRAALELLAQALARSGPALTTFEMVCDSAIRLVERHFPKQRWPLAERYPYGVLLELSVHDDEAHGRAVMEQLLAGALVSGLIGDAVVAQSVAQGRELWALRENISEAQSLEGANIKHDISVPIARIAEFVESTDAALYKAFPGVELINFGHLGDGNLHYNVSAATAEAREALQKQRPAVNLLVHDAVHAVGGSISAEHGLGQLKRDEIRRYKSPIDLAVMASIKRALDPNNLMNPGKVL